MYLSIFIVSAPVNAANARGEGNGGNGQTLQKVSTGSGTYTLLTGQSIRHALRDSMLATGAEMWRKHVPEGPQCASGYVYGPDNEVTMKDAIPASPFDYDDTALFGYMVTAKGDSVRATKRLSAVAVSDAISASPYLGDAYFHVGLSADNDNKMPFTQEVHATRYYFTVTINLYDLVARPEAVARLIDALGVLKVGGGHAAHSTEIIPDAVAWRMHQTPGGGLGFGPGVRLPCEEPVPLALVQQRMKQLDLASDEVQHGGFAGSVDSAGATLRQAMKAACGHLGLV